MSLCDTCLAFCNDEWDCDDCDPFEYEYEYEEEEGSDEQGFSTTSFEKQV